MARAKGYVCVSLTALALFLGVAFCVHQHQPQVMEWDHYAADTARTWQQDSPGGTAFFDALKEAAGLAPMIGLVAGMAVVLIVSGRCWLAGAWVIAVEAAALFNDHVLKPFFHRERPPFAHPKGPTDWSFPSGHSLRAMVLYGFLAYLLIVLLPWRWARVLVVAVLAVVIGLVGFSRVFLGKHYPSDVAGGFAFGAAWLAAWLALVEFRGWQKPPVRTPPTEG